MSKLPNHRAGSTDGINGSTNEISNGRINGLLYGYDGDSIRVPIAICGVGARLCCDICNRDSLKDSLMDERDARGFTGFVESKDGGLECGNCLEKEIACFDASIFSMAKEELESCSPNERVLLGVVRECFEDAGEIQYCGENALVAFFVESNDLTIGKRTSLEYDFRGPR